MKNSIGIRRENKDLTERRAPLTPRQVGQLVSRYGLRIALEPSPNRIFPDEAYERAGAQISTDLSECHLIFGVKEIPPPDLKPNQVYCFFSHTVKGQLYNMPMLQRIIDLKDTLIDYELVTNSEGKRLISFGKFAGYAGMIDTLWVLGKRLLWEGFENPFQDVKQAHRYSSLSEAKTAIRGVGDKIKKDGLPRFITPFICGITGRGNVSQGAQAILDLLPVVEVEPRELIPFVRKGRYSNKLIYKVVFKKPDMYEPVSVEQDFVTEEFTLHPNRYRSCFHRYLPHLSVLVNAIFWEPRFPRLVTKEFLRAHFSGTSQPRLKIIGDITCDIEGSIEVTVKATTYQNPVYVYEPLTDRIIDGWEGKGPVILAVDKLPTELPREASESFGNALLPFIPALASTDFQVSFTELNIPEAFRKAVIAHQGELTPDYRYLREYLPRKRNNPFGHSSR